MRQHQRTAEDVGGKTRQEGHERRGFHQAGAQRIGHGDPALAHRLHQARHAQPRVRVQLQRIGEVRIQAAQQHIHPLEPGDGAHIHHVAAHGEITALHQQETEIAGEQRVLEIGFVERTRRQQANAALAVESSFSSDVRKLWKKEARRSIRRLREMSGSARVTASRFSSA